MDTTAPLSRIGPAPEARNVTRLVPVDNRDPCAAAFAAICMALEPLQAAQRRAVLNTVREIVDER